MKRHGALEKLDSQIRRRFGRLMCALALGFLGVNAAEASGLRISVRIESDRATDIIPVTRNFKPCFKPNASGVPTMGLCAIEEPERLPAQAPPHRSQRRQPSKYPTK